MGHGAGRRREVVCVGRGGGINQAGWLFSFVPPPRSLTPSPTTLPPTPNQQPEQEAGQLSLLFDVGGVLGGAAAGALSDSSSMPASVSAR